MEKKDNTPKTREQIFKEKADTYSVCYSTVCPLREHCLHCILSAYTPQDRMLVQSVNLNNPEMQREGCPWFRNDEPIRMPVGLSTMYYDMPGRIEREPPYSCLFPQALLRIPQRHSSSNARCRALRPSNSQKLRLDSRAHLPWLRRRIPVVTCKMDDVRWMMSEG